MTAFSFITKERKAVISMNEEELEMFVTNYIDRTHAEENNGNSKNSVQNEEKDVL